MTENLEQQIKEQQNKRLQTETAREAFLKGTPLPGSMEELLEIVQNKLKESPVLVEFIRREHVEASLAKIEKFYEDKIDMVLDVLLAKLLEIEDNFNLFAQQSLEAKRLHDERVHKTLDLLDKVIVQEY